MEMSHAATAGRRRRNVILAVVLVLVALFIGGIGWVVWWVSDNIGAPGPPPTGSGACTSADAVNLQLVFADGHTVQACTRDQPVCPNQNINGPGNGQPNASQFTLSNQLRSSSRRYILFIRFDAALPAETSVQTLTLAPGPGFLPGEPVSSTLISPLVQVTPRDPYENGYTTVSGSLAVASSHGVAHGRIDGSFTGPTRPDRPAPSSSTVSPVRIAGTFACNH